MASVLVRVNEATREHLKEIATTDGETMQAVVEQAVEGYRKKRILEATNAAYAALRADPEAWRAEMAERRLWESTLLDGLDADEHWEKPEGGVGEAEGA